jgi:hypothetical protein
MRTYGKWLGSLLLVALAVAGAGSVAPVIGRAAASGKFTLAVLRRDGIVIPFATYSGRYWFNYWPTPALQVDVPLSLDFVPKGDWPDKKPVLTWTAWPTSGGSRVINVLKPAWIPAHCMMNVGLQTDYKPREPAPPLEVQPYPKDGLATDGDVRIEPVEILNEKSPDWKTVIAEVSAAVTKEETKGVRALEQYDWRHPDTLSARAATPLNLDVLCRTPGAAAGSRVYYFEGSKRYRNPDPKLRVGGKSCDIITFARGWLLQPATGEPTRDVKVNLTDCRMEGIVYTLPLGAFRIKKDLFWAVQVSGWLYERYDVLELTDKVKSRRETPGGWCR